MRELWAVLEQVNLSAIFESGAGTGYPLLEKASNLSGGPMPAIGAGPGAASRQPGVYLLTRPPPTSTWKRNDIMAGITGWQNPRR